MSGEDGSRPAEGEPVSEADQAEAEGSSSETEPAIEPGTGVRTEEYLDEEINLFRPATPFMRDHLKVIWLAFAAWVLFVFGPVTATAIAPEVMTGTMVLGFQLHYLLTAVVAPLGALLLSAAYALQRDRLDDQYGITHEVEGEADSDDNTEGDTASGVATDGGDDI